MRRIEDLSAVVRHAWTEPKAVAQMQWHGEFGLAAQLVEQIPDDEARHYLRTGQHVNPTREISLVWHEEPDWDWWEPRHDQPWRRRAARDRGDSA